MRLAKCGKGLFGGLKEEIDICVRMGGGDEVDLKLRGLQIDTTVKHAVEEASIERRIAPLGLRQVGHRELVRGEGGEDGGVSLHAQGHAVAFGGGVPFTPRSIRSAIAARRA